MTIAITAATVDDARRLALLNRAIQQLHAAFEPTVFRANTDDAEIEAFFAEKLTLSGNHFRIAATDTGPAGYAWFEVQERPQLPLTQPRKRMHVHHLSVEPDYRRQGVASALLDHVEREARSRGITTMSLDTWAANLPAHAFFSNRGFVPFNISFGKRLS